MSDACEAWFYHLEGLRADDILPELLEKTLARRWRALVRAASVATVERLDGWLWTYRDDAFLPHGTASQPDADRQPVLLTTEGGNPNGAHVLFLLDGAQPGDLSGFVRCALVFDGADAEALDGARRLWRTFKDEGRPASYWRRGGRGWEKQA